jgi:hypothetical protein
MDTCKKGLKENDKRVKTAAAPIKIWTKYWKFNTPIFAERLSYGLHDQGIGVLYLAGARDFLLHSIKNNSGSICDTLAVNTTNISK